MHKKGTRIRFFLKVCESCTCVFLTYFDKFSCLFLAVIPEAAVDPQSQQFKWRLRAKKVVCWHVQVVKETKQMLPTCWHKHAFGPLLDAALYDGLDVIRGGLYRNIDHKNT